MDIADELEHRKLYRFAEQLRGSVPCNIALNYTGSMSNNIAEGSGSVSKNEFKQFLNIARRSTFENANILIVLNRRKLLSDTELNNFLDTLDILCRQITKFRNSLN